MKFFTSTFVLFVIADDPLFGRRGAPLEHDQQVRVSWPARVRVNARTRLRVNARTRQFHFLKKTYFVMRIGQDLLFMANDSLACLHNNHLISNTMD